MSKFEKQVIQLAEILQDPKGKLDETIDFIALELQVSISDVRRVFKGK
jgi:NADH:ubiquinone oxidoreductase subunit E